MHTIPEDVAIIYRHFSCIKAIFIIIAQKRFLGKTVKSLQIVVDSPGSDPVAP